MGFISSLAKSGGNIAVATKSESDRLRWRRTFGVVSKEDSHRKPRVDPRNYSSTLGSPASVEQLLKALRSQAPGGWSDNRWEQSNHFVGIAYVAIHRASEQLAQSEFEVLQKDPNHPEGFHSVHSDHPLVKLLEHPNNDDTFGDLMYRLCMQLGLTGSALIWMVPNRLGIPVELYPIPTALAVPQSTQTPEYPDGYYRVQPIYPYGPFSVYPTPLSAAGACIPGQWMLRVQYPHPLLRYEGYSPLSAMRLHMDEIEAIDRSRWYSQRRAINPSAVLNFDEMEGSEPLPEAEISRIHAEFENEQMGPENTGRLFISTPGARLEPWGASPKDMEYQSGWDQLTSFTLAGLGISKPAAGIVETSGYATLFASLKQFHMLTLEPMCARISGRLTRHLASFFGDNLVVRIRTQRIDDHDIKNAKLNMLISAKCITKQELRKELDMPPTNAEWANDIAGDLAGTSQPSQSKEVLEQQQQQQEQQQQQMQMAQMGGMGGGALQPGMEEQQPEAAPVEGEPGGMPQQPDLGGVGEMPPPPELGEAPTPGTLNEGSLGPRKNLEYLHKSLYKNIRSSLQAPYRYLASKEEDSSNIEIGEELLKAIDKERIFQFVSKGMRLERNGNNFSEDEKSSSNRRSWRKR